MEKWYNHYVRTIAFFVEMADPFRYFTSSRFLQGSKKSRCAMLANKRTIDKGIIAMRKSVRTHENIFNNRNKRSCFPCFLFFFAAICFLNTNSVLAQTYPATLKVPVTFYDFHADGSNPEFEKNPDANGSTGTHRGMVASTLGPNQEAYPLALLLTGTAISPNGLSSWTPGDFTIPNYTPPAIPATPGMTNCSNGFKTVNYDTAFKNIEIDTFLIFTLVPLSQGTYQFHKLNVFFLLMAKGLALMKGPCSQP